MFSCSASQPAEVGRAYARARSRRSNDHGKPRHRSDPGRYRPGPGDGDRADDGEERDALQGRDACQAPRPHRQDRRRRRAGVAAHGQPQGDPAAERRHGEDGSHRSRRPLPDSVPGAPPRRLPRRRRRPSHGRRQAGPHARQARQRVPDGRRLVLRARPVRQLDRMRADAVALDRGRREQDPALRHQGHASAIADAR